MKGGGMECQVSSLKLKNKNYSKKIKFIKEIKVKK